MLPYLIWRIIRRLNVTREIHEILQPSSALVAGALAVVFALAVAYRVGQSLELAGTVAVLALTVMLSMKLIGFLMLAVRHEALSQILGLARAGERHLSRRADPRARHAAADRDRHPVRPPDRRRLLRGAGALSRSPMSAARSSLDLKRLVG